MNKQRSPRPPIQLDKRESGSSLIETVIALVILSIVVLGVFAAFCVFDPL